MREGLGTTLPEDGSTALVEDSEFARFKVLGTDKTANNDFKDDNSGCSNNKSL
jgi:hypothetical protein